MVPERFMDGSPASSVLLEWTPVPGLTAGSYDAEKNAPREIKRANRERNPTLDSTCESYGDHVNKELVSKQL